MPILYNSHPKGLLTYAAPSAKWTRRANGLIAQWSAGSDLPYEWDDAGLLAGIMLEPQATNLALRSNDFANASWSKTLGPVTITANSDTSPDGAVNAHRIVEANANTNHGMLQSFTVTNGARYTMSAWIKAGTRTWFRLTEGAGVTAAAWFNLSTGALGTVSGTGTPVGRIRAFPNGWYRCSLSFTAIGTAANMQVRLAAADGGGSYAGDGTGYIIGYGAQFEAGSAPSSYIPTVASTVTRAVDDLSLLTSAFPYSATAGTLMVQYRSRFVDISATQALATLNDGTLDEEIMLGMFGAADNLSVRDGAASQANIAPAGAIAANTSYKLAAAWAANDFAVCRNGGTVVTDASGTLPTLTRLRIGGRAGPSLAHPILIQKIAYFPRRFSNAELQALTA